MQEAGVALKPGETAEYIIIDASGKKNPEKAKPYIMYRSEDGYDIEKYTELTLKSIAVLLEPLGYSFEKISEIITGVKAKHLNRKSKDKTGSGWVQGTLNF